MEKGAGVVTLERVLVGLDGSEGSARALHWAIDLAKAVGAEVLAVHAFEQPYPVVPPSAEVPVGMVVDEVEAVQALRVAVEQAFVTEWSAPLEGAGVRYRRLLEEGSPGDVLLEVAAREQPGLIVTGRRGRRPLAELLAGSVSHHLVHRSPIPVAIVPGAGDHDERRKRS
jgi:nucleotide-binding universal stress UspA family protein